MKTTKKGQIRYAVVGLGYISQIAVLPAFAHARANSRLTALVSGDPSKLKAMAKKYERETDVLRTNSMPTALPAARSTPFT